MPEIPNPHQRIISRDADGPRMSLPAHFVSHGRLQILVAPSETIRIDRMALHPEGDFHPTITLITARLGSGLAIVLNAEECRVLAEQLLTEAAILENGASAAATAAIDKALGGK